MSPPRGPVECGTRNAERGTRRHVQIRRGFRLLLVVAFLSGLGCTPHEELRPSKLVQDLLFSGNHQCGIQGSELPIPLRVTVYGTRKAARWFGPSEKEMEGVPVAFSVENPESGAIFVETGTGILETATGAGGGAKAALRLGDRCGDVRVTASIDTPDGPRSVRFRAAAGVERIGKDLEGPTGGKIDAFGVRLFDAPGQPAAGVLVHFRPAGESSGAKLGAEMLRTDEKGEAVTSWKLGDSTQRYFASVQIQDDRPGVAADRRFSAQALQFEAIALNKAGMLLTLLGGLAVFIFGMNMMSASLQRMADRRLKVILQAATRNRFVATAVGAGVTSVIQSSSATTVMVVGFVNAGLITLTQAIGVIYGANIGTTMTAQIIAFNLEDLCYPAIGIGLILATLSRRPAIRALGKTILGFGFLFLGMMTMSGILKPLRYSPEFRAWFLMFDCTPVDGRIPAGAALMSILIGTAMTCVIQSSSATVGLVQALASQGLISFYTAVPLVLGDNIGTTITAILASLGANRNAKRTAVAHSLFNIFGATYMYILLFVPLWDGQPIFLGFIDYITPGNAFGEVPENLARHVANAHSMFNIFNCIIFLPLVVPLARLCQKIIPVTDADRETVLQYLEPHLLISPSLALRQAVKEVAYMVGRAHKSIDESFDYFFSFKDELQKNVLRREDLLDRLQQEITAYMVDLSRKPLSPDEALLVPALIHAVNDAERIGDHSENLLELAHLRRENKHPFSETAGEDLRRFQDLLDRQFEATYSALVDADPDQVDLVLKIEDEINALTKIASEHHVERLENGECDVQAGVVFLEFVGNLERIGDRLANIAERAGQFLKVVPR